jgi:peptidyl-prolyl cis-trans isomerase A (cyclophilin A)
MRNLTPNILLMSILIIFSMDLRAQTPKAESGSKSKSTPTTQSSKPIESTPPFIPTKVKKIPPATPTNVGPEKNKLAKSVHAIFNIKWGKTGKKISKIKVKLFHRRTPITVKNFTDLAEGRKSYKVKSVPKKGKYYDNLIFHRIIRGFMIQGGDRNGGPGYKFADEFHPALKHNQPGMFSMANAGKNTNGSQFFITVAPQPHLDNRHTIFGKVVEGIEDIIKISKERTDRLDRPKYPVTIQSLTIERK